MHSSIRLSSGDARDLHCGDCTDKLRSCIDLDNLTAKANSCLMSQMTSSVESGPGNPVPDAVAVERTLAGDRDAYRVLVERHSLNVYRLAYRMAGNSHDAE